MSIIAHRVKVGFICAKKFQNQGVFIRKISGFGVQSQTGVYMNIIEILKEGRHYMERWPEEPLLNPVFPECRAKKLMSLAKRVIPPFMVLCKFKRHRLFYVCSHNDTSAGVLLVLQKI